MDDLEEFCTDEISNSQNEKDSETSEYCPDYSEESDMSSTKSSQESVGDMFSHLIKGTKAIVYVSSLMALFATCSVAGCGAAIDPANRKVTNKGAVVIVDWTCNNHHCGRWCGSPIIGEEGKNKTYALNALIATFSLNCGLHISQILEFFAHLRIVTFGNSFFYNIQSKLLTKIVWLVWSKCQKVEINHSKSRSAAGEKLKIAGDGKFDSRGFSASYCTYTMMDLFSNKVIHFWVAHKDMVTCSANMEPFAAKNLLLNLAWVHQLPIDSLTTDRSTSMKSMMESIGPELPQDYTPPKHYFDIWHWIKAVLKDLWAATKLVSCAGLGEWVPSINNMMWFSFSSCQDDPELLKEKLLSIPDHISNVHEYPENEVYKMCPHPPLVEERSKAWLSSESLAVKKVRTALRGADDSRLKDVDFMTGFTHTGPIESWNALHNKYANKNYFYSYEGMLVRGALAALDHNSNTDRVQARTQEGNLRFDLVKNRFGNKWTVKTVMEAKNKVWRDDIAYLVLKALDCGRRPKIELPVGDKGANIRTSAPRPSKDDAIKKQQSRMQQS